MWELLSVRGSNIKCTAMQSMMAATTSCSVFDPWVRKERRKRRQFERSGERGGIHWISMLGGQDLDSGRLFVFLQRIVEPRADSTMRFAM